MSFEAIDYQQKRLRMEGDREWKIWYTETEAGLEFRLLTKDAAGTCYETLSGLAEEEKTDLMVCEDDSGDARFSDLFRFKDEKGRILIFLEAGDRELVWLEGEDAYATDGCSFVPSGPLMPEVAG